MIYFDVLKIIADNYTLALWSSRYLLTYSLRLPFSPIPSSLTKTNSRDDNMNKLHVV